MKISANFAAIVPVKATPGAAAAARSVPASESAQPVPKPSQPVESRAPVDNPLKGERVTGSAAATVRAQHIQPTPEAPRPVETKHVDLNLGSHNASPGSQAYQAVAASSEQVKKGAKVNTSA